MKVQDISGELSAPPHRGLGGLLLELKGHGLAARGTRGR
jgi:hypothetical protein